MNSLRSSANADSLPLVVTDSLDSSEGATTLASVGAEGDACKALGVPKYCFLDVETTGFAAMRHCVITLAAFVTDDTYQIIDHIYLEFRPDGSKKVCWTDEAEKIHKIPWEKAIAFPPLEESFFKLRDFLDRFAPLILVAHNMPFERIFSIRPIRYHLCLMDSSLHRNAHSRWQDEQE